MKRFLAFTALLLCSWSAALALQPAAPQPERPLKWQFVSTESFEEEQPGMGSGMRYRAGQTWMDIYVYDLQQRHWKTGVSDPNFSEHFLSTINAVRHYGKAGVYAQLQIDAPHDELVDGQMYRAVSMRFVRDGTPMHSVLYLTGNGGKLLKYRLTTPAASGIDADAAVRRFITDPPQVEREDVREEDLMGPITQRVPDAVSTHAATGR